jgi:hypothetical protein
MGNVRYQVFVSSTFEDLHTERQEIMHRLLGLQQLVKSSPAIGWIKADSAAEKFAAQELSRLRNCITTLEHKLVEAMAAASRIVIDATGFMDDPDKSFSDAISDFESFGELLNEIYTHIKSRVGPYEYGHTWVLADKLDGHILESVTMIHKMARGHPFPDKRPLAELKITPGCTLVVTTPERAVTAFNVLSQDT